MHVSRLTECHGYLCKTALRPREHFSSGNPTTILSHLRTLEREPGRAYLRLLEPSGFPRPRPLSRDKHILGCSCPSPQGSRQLLRHWLHYCTRVIPSTHLFHPGFGDLDSCHHPIGYYLGWESKCSFSFRAKGTY